MTDLNLPRVADFIIEMQAEELAVRLIESAGAVKRPKNKTVFECLADVPDEMRQQFMLMAETAIVWFGECAKKLDTAIMTARDEEFQRYIRDRDETLRKLDPQACIAHFKKYGLPEPPGGWSDPVEVPMIMMHKCRLEITSFSEAEKAQSRKWLAERGYRGFDGNSL